MLEKVLTDNNLIREYCSLSCSGLLPILVELQWVLDVGEKSKRGVKRKGKASTSESMRAPKKIKKPAQKPRSLSTVLQEDSD